MASAFATYARDDALDYRVIEQSQDAFEIDVRERQYAEFYKELGEPELGLSCDGRRQGFSQYPTHIRHAVT